MSMDFMSEIVNVVKNYNKDNVKAETLTSASLDTFRKQDPTSTSKPGHTCSSRLRNIVARRMRSGDAENWAGVGGERKRV